MGKYHLVKSSTDKYIAGVCGGIAETFNIDPTLVRIVWSAVTLLTGGFAGIILYIVAAVIMPAE